MKRFAIALLLSLSAVSFAKDKDTTPLPNACLAVYPGGQACLISFGPRRGTLTSGCFSYFESTNMPLKSISTYYLQKDLEKLEARGARIVVTNGNAHTGSACFDQK